MRKVQDKQNLLFVIFGLFFGLTLAPASGHAMNQCQRLFKPGAPVMTDQLGKYNQTETAAMTTREIKKANRATLDGLQSTVPVSVAGRASSVPYATVWKVLELIKEHEIVSPAQKTNYEPEGTDIGYCFGRATFAHLAFLKMGLQEESIRKIWAVGSIKTPASETSWSFHVATAVYTREKGWVTIDTGEFKPEELRHWMSAYEGQSVDGRLRFYVTEASKMSLDLGPYNRLQMGLDVQPAKDWYRGYFAALLKSIRETSLESMGFTRLPSEVAQERVAKTSSLKPLVQGPTGDETTFFYMKKLFGF